MSENIILMQNNLQIAVSKLERKIEKHESEYKKWLCELKKYEDSLAQKHGEIDDVLAHKGFIEIKDELIEEVHAIKNS